MLVTLFPRCDNFPDYKTTVHYNIILHANAPENKNFFPKISDNKTISIFIC